WKNHTLTEPNTISPEIKAARSIRPIEPRSALAMIANSYAAKAATAREMSHHAVLTPGRVKRPRTKAEPRREPSSRTIWPVTAWAVRKDIPPVNTGKHVITKRTFTMTRSAKRLRAA